MFIRTATIISHINGFCDQKLAKNLSRNNVKNIKQLNQMVNNSVRIAKPPLVANNAEISNIKHFGCDLNEVPAAVPHN